MIMISDGVRFDEHKYKLEADFEADLVTQSDAIFGKHTVFIDAKKKIGTFSLGNTIPDGFLFDLSDSDNFEFYIVEVELAKHDFYRHIFPQITKFFAFFKNIERQKELVEKLFTLINTDDALREKFKKYLGDEEVYKFLSDLIESSQNILLVIDDGKPEIPEITNTYTDTWGKMVRLLEVRKFVGEGKEIYSVSPAFETLEYSADDTTTDSDVATTSLTEDFHLGDTSDSVKQIYGRLKEIVHAIDGAFVFNVQKHYISIRGSKNFIYLIIKKKKIRMIALLPEEKVREIVLHHPVKSLSESVQGFYNAPCAAVELDNLSNFEEIDSLIKAVVKNFSPEGVEETVDA